MSSTRETEEPVVSTPPGLRAPMSFEQESIWLDDQFVPGSGRYVESWTHRLRGDLDTDAVAAALTGIVARHAPLRSALVLADGRTVQRVAPPAPVPLDVRSVLPGELEEALRAAVSGPLPLDRPPLLRATLLRCGPRDAVLAVAVHHAVIDGWSLRLFDEEFAELYRAAVEGRPPELPDPVPSFAAYAAARRADTAGADADLEHWLTVLADAPAETSFPLDHPRPPRLGPAGGEVGFTVGPELGAAVRHICRMLRSTSFTVLAAALTALTGRLTDQDDLVIGTPVSRRDRLELEPVVGCLTDVMPLRQRLRPGLTFRELVADTAAVVRDAMAHRRVPHSRLVRELGRPRTGSRFPLFQIVLTVDDAGGPGLRLPGVSTERLYPHNGTAKFDVFLHLVPYGGGYFGRLEYAAELFSPATARRLADRFLALLADATAHPDRAVDDLVVMDDAERRRLVARSGSAADPAGPPPSAAEAVARTARRVPDAVAVDDGREELTYAQLWARSGAVARALVARGLTGHRVALRGERSAGALTALLGVLRAGAACVCVDPAWPEERVAFVLRDSGAAALLTEDDGDPGPLPPGITVLRPGDLTDAPDLPLPQLRSEAPAYVVYTSGSTGRPKGVALPHRSLASLVDWQCRASTAADGTRTLQLASLGFDVAFQEIFATWGSGGRLVLVPDEVRGDPHRLLDLVERHAVERIHLPYVALQQLADYTVAVGRRADSLREVVTAGEELIVTPAIRSFFTSAAPRARLENQYGPSETHVVTRHPLTGDPASWPDRPPIGRPVPRSTVRVLDARLRPRPFGVPGEICVGGACVGTGYVGDAPSDRFVPDPADPGGTGLLYRTGDIGTIREDGTIRFLGRADGQVKIRGHRVEPGEVEAVLQGVPGVGDAVVLVTGESAGSRRLVACYTGRADPGQVRAALGERLPPPLVPTVLLPVPAFPRTATGKTDRAALRLRYADARPARPAHRDTVAPDTVPGGLTKAVAGVWADVLGAGQVGPDDEFFELGGDSLLAVRLVVALRAELGLALRPGDVFAAPTPAALARLARIPGGGPEASDLAAEAVLDPAIVPAPGPVRSAAAPREVLLTGATGFLGAFVLRDLLERTGAVVHCLVRAADPQAAEKRLRHTLDRYGLASVWRADRIRPLPGDLARPRFGLTPEDADRLARTVDAVFHVGASVNLTWPYERLKAANVDGTAEVLRLAAAHRTVPVHHVSTVGVYPPAGPPFGRISADTPRGDGSLLRHGYARTKWVAEALVDEARRRGLPVTVFRPTRISGDTTTGVCQTSDFLWLLLKGCLQVGAAPDDYTSAFDLVPVDGVSAAVVSLAVDPATAGRTYHVSGESPLPFAEAVRRLRALGHTLDGVPLTAWHRRVERDPANAAFPLLGLIPSAGSRPEEPDAGAPRVFDSASTRRALRETSVGLPPVDEALFAHYVAAFVREGFLPPPGGGAARHENNGGSDVPAGRV
ncbi:non-ribosomal peptide synthetase [Streptomyces sp. TP-A0356]|uniref:non-ribosomal peptide synthetase n=1 Tax=Streptomyces sp. TP-A0356 TaxID=1359208 RepID=UPI0006E1DCB7|nr:non-ribosomal peptide synthetase [Streptomyces sp. TP-A0356]